MSISRYLRRSRWDDERAHELEVYLDIETDENIARGMTPEEARFAARRKLGNATQIREVIYEMNTITFIETVWQDLKHAVRLLRHNPAFACVAIVSLALGTGANTAMFQLVDAVRLRTLPVERPEELAEVRVAVVPNGRQGSFNGRRAALTNPQWELIRDQQQAFSHMMAWTATRFDLATGGEVRPTEAVWIAGDFFTTLGVKPLIGRVLTSADDRRGCPAPGVVISYGFWQRQFGGDPAVLGRPLTLDGRAFDIIGVTPASFFGVDVGRTFDVALPLCAEPLLLGTDTRLDRRDSWFLAAIGRLKPGWTVDRASAHLNGLSQGIVEATLPDTYNADGVKNYLAFKFGAFPFSTGASALRTRYATSLWILLGVTGLVLLITCANLANLMLARATAREREVAVRLAIGASRRRVVRQLLSESLLLAAIGTIGGLIVAAWFSRVLVRFLSSANDPLFVDLPLDWRVFAFTSAVAVTACLFFGLAPALRATRLSPGAAMKAGGRGSTDTRERFSIRRGLVVVQVALSLVLLVGALLFVGSLRHLMTTDPGFRADGVIHASLDLRRADIPPENRERTFQDIVARVRAVPGVRAVAEVMVAPITGSLWNRGIYVDGKLVESSLLNAVSPGYFRTMDTPVIKGRDFDSRDTSNAPRVAIVNARFVERFLKGADPVGRVFQLEDRKGQLTESYEIVGIVKNTKYYDLKEDFESIAFVPLAQRPERATDTTVAVRTDAISSALTGALVRAVTDVHPAIAVQIDTLTQQIEESLARERLMAFLSGLFGGLAALIAMIGLYGVMSYMVVRRRTEIGIRMALGADRVRVVRMIVREAGLLVIIGMTLGIGLALAAARTASALLFGLQPWDPPTLATALVSLGTVAALASWVPAYRASRVPPTTALRQD